MAVMLCGVRALEVCRIPNRKLTSPKMSPLLNTASTCCDTTVHHPVKARRDPGGVGAAIPRQEMSNLEDPAAAVPVLPGGGRFGPFLCHFYLLALAFHPSGWGLVSDSGTIACLELLW